MGMAHRALKPILFLACLWPALRLAVGAAQLSGLLGALPAVPLGADPIAVLLHGAGRWALNLLLITLAMTPLRDLTGWPIWLRLRRMVGLFAFFYAALHLAVYLFLDQGGDFAALWRDVVKRPYITIGMAALLMLVPLALTSTDRAQRRLRRRWTRLHALVYPVAVLGVWHFWWQVKKDIREPALYALGLAVLLGYRLWKRRAALSAARSPAIRAACQAGIRSYPSRCTDP